VSERSNEAGIVPVSDPKTSEGTYEARIHRSIEEESGEFSSKKNLFVVFSTRFSLLMHSFSTVSCLTRTCAHGTLVNSRHRDLQMTANLCASNSQTHS
jgi:hypothetical protein